MSIPEPWILAIDTSTSACDVALIKGADLVAHQTEVMAKGQAERLLVLCSELLDRAGIAPRDLAAVGVGIGPGNFTGIRISVSAARGLALALDVPAVGVSAFDALRHGTPGSCVASVDARRDQVYVQQFDEKGLVGTPKLVSRSELADFETPVVGEGGDPQAYPSAVSIAHITQTRYRSQQPRPAPLYIRPADAAPAKDAAPVILP